MSEPFLLQAAWLGIDRDSSRDQARGQASYNLQDYIPARLDAPLRKRGGWSYQSTAMGACTFADVLCHAPFTAGTKLLSIGSDANLYDNTSGTPSSIGASLNGAQNPVFFNNAVAMFDRAATTAPKVYDTAAGLATMGGTPPTAKFGCAFKGRLAAAKDDKVYFAPTGWGPGAYTTWDTTNAVTPPLGQIVNGIAPTASSILVFHDALVERLRGSIPFGTTNSDMVIEPLWGGIGCADARSIVNWNDQVLWADTRGVYQTDGAAMRDLTTLTGMKSLWQSALASWSAPTSASAGWRIAGGIYRDHYIVAVTNQTTFQDCFVFDLSRQLGWRFQNFPVRAFHRAIGASDESYMALANAGRTATLSSCWSPAAGNKNDADGSAVLPVWESTFYRGYTRWHRKWVMSMGRQRWHYLYVTYECADAAADNPLLTVTVATTPDAGSTYATTLAPTLAKTTAYTRVRVPVRLGANGLSVKIAQTNASADTRLYALEADYEPIEGHRL